MNNCHPLLLRVVENFKKMFLLKVCVQYAEHVQTLKEGGDFVLIVNAPTDQVTHFVHGRWGTEVFGDLCLAPPSLLNRAGRIILFSEYPVRQPCLELVPPEKTVKIKTWEEVIEELKIKHKHKARVAVYPDATIQKPF